MRVHEAVAEAIDIGEHCGVHVQIAHMKLSGTDSWGQADRGARRGENPPRLTYIAQ